MDISEEGYELVRVSTRVLEELTAGPSAPVVVMGIQRLEDGSWDLTLQRPEIAAERDRYRAALEKIAAASPHQSDHCPNIARASLLGVAP